MNRNLSLVTAVFTALMLAACSTVGDLFEEADKPLPGERISVLELQKDLEPDDTALSAMGFVAPSPWQNEFWPQAGGYPNHSMQHLALAEGELTKKWSTSVGRGGSDRLPLTGQPVVVDGRIFTLDAGATVAAFDSSTGKQVWATKVSPADEREPVIGGGVAYAGGRLYVTGGYGEVLALDPSNGDILWRKETLSPSRAAPTIVGEQVFVSTLDNRVLALSAADGVLNWEHTALAESAGLVGAASPAANQDIVVPVFSSGEIFALRVENGSVAWSDNLSALRSFGGLSGLSDITGLPVIDKGLVIAVSFSGRMVAIDERTGSRVWQREVSSSETPWVAGNHVFLTTSDGKLVALGRDNGAIRWVRDLNDKDDRKPPVWTGPVLAGGRLFVASSEGRMREISPETGDTIREWSAGRSVSIPPLVAGGILYVLTDSGTLMAYE